MLPESISQAFARTERRLVQSDGAEGILARREAGRPRPDDADNARRIAEGIVLAQAEDGSWGGALGATAEHLLVLHDLAGGDRRDAEVDGAIARGVEWVRARQGKPGRFGGDCVAARHERGLCHHFLAGFFSPAPPEKHDYRLVLGIGVEVEPEHAARFAASCMALRALFRWGVVTTDGKLHLAGLHRILREWDPRASQSLPPAAVLPAIATLLDAPESPESAAAIQAGLGRVRQLQRADGSWAEVDLFQVLDVVLLAASHGIDGGVARSIRLAGGLLAALQAPDGTWGQKGPPLRTLIGWRALRFAAVPPENGP